MVRKSAVRIIFGLILLAIAVIWAGSAFGFWEIGYIKGWWTIFLIVPGIAGMISDKLNFFNVGLTIVGVWLFLRQQNFETITDTQLDIGAGAVAVAFVGLWFIFGKTFRRQTKPVTDGADFSGDAYEKPNDFVNAAVSDNRNDYTAIFTGGKHINDSKQFGGANATAIFGGLELDFTRVDFSGTAQINTCAVFGGIKIYVPRDVRIVMDGTPIMGGFQMKAPYYSGDSGKTLRITGASIFGGVEIL